MLSKYLLIDMIYHKKKPLKKLRAFLQVGYYQNKYPNDKPRVVFRNP